ncbi:MAG: phosphate ABC transporter substrate-binding protein [Anaerolineae bacterium]
MTEKASFRLAGCAVALLLLLTGCRPATDGTPEAGAVATIENKGSDTMVNIALAWAERYQDLHPEVRLAVTGGGSGTGIAALINGTVDIANASRSIKAEEREAAVSNGVDPVEFVVARDAIAVIVHLDNPVDRLTLQQISDIYSGKIDNWSEVGGEDRPIVRLSRETNSGTHVYFLESVVRLGQADDTTLFTPDTLLLSSSEGIGTEVRQNPNAIGYDGLGYVTGEMKTIAIGLSEEGPFWQPSVETVNSGKYPIARDLYMYTANEPQGVILAYLDWIRQPEAQEIVRELGFVPIIEE